MRNLIFLIIVLALQNVSAKTLQKIYLSVGEQKVVPLQSKGSLTLSNPLAIKALPTAKGVHLIAKKMGRSEIVAGQSRIAVVVVNRKVADLIKESSPLVVSAENLVFDVNPESVTISGTVLRLEDWMSLQRWKHRYPRTLFLETSTSESVTQQLKALVTKRLREKALSSAKIEEGNDTLRLVSNSTKKGEVEQLRQISEEYGLAAPQKTQAVELRPMIEINIIIAEVKKAISRNLGLVLPGTFTASLVPTANWESSVLNFASMTPELHARLQNETGKVIANPKLVCRSGETARFLAGGEIPIPVKSLNSADVLWKKYGVILDISPTADLNDAISTKIVTEISLLDETHKVDGIPGLLTDRIETHFDLRGSKTIALSGLIKSEVGRNSKGTPLLSEIPILGELFKSHEYQDSKTELVVFVTPKVISPEDPVTVKTMPSWMHEDL